MELPRTLEILDALSSGINPITGEQLENSGPLQHAEVVRALFVALDAVQRRANALKRKSTRPTNTGQTWTREEVAQLCVRYSQKMPIWEIANAHGRSTGAVVARLVHLECIDLTRLSEARAAA